MFIPHGSFQFLKKFRSLSCLCTKTPILCNKTITNTIHSLHQPKQNRPFKQINPKINKKFRKSITKESVDPPKIVYMRETITKISNILRYSAWDNAQEELRKLSIKWDSYTVTQVLKTHPPMEKAWLFFNWADKLKGFKHDQFTYTTMLDIFGEARRISSMMYVFERMQEKGITIDVVTYTSLLHWFSNDGDVDGAVKLWQEMKGKGFSPTVVSYTAYMKVLFDHDRVKEASEVYKEMLEADCSPNCHTYTVLMEHLANLGKFGEVLEIFSKMQEAGVQPDKAMCNILIEKCCKAGKTREITEILHYMNKNSLVLRHAVYQEAIKTFKDARESDLLLRQVHRHFSNFNEERTEKFDQTAIDVKSTSDGPVIFSLLNKKNLVAIDHLLTSMMDRSIRLDSGIISNIIEVNIGCCRENGAMLAFDYSVKHGIAIHNTAYLALIGMFIRINSFPKVVEIIEKMVGEGLSLGTQLSALLIYRLGCAKEPDAAANVFSLLPDEHQNTATYTALISAFFASRNAEKGLETFETMRRRGIKVALGTYSVLLTGLEKCRKRRELELYKKEKKSMQAMCNTQVISTEEKICNLLFAGYMII